MNNTKRSKPALILFLLLIIGVNIAADQVSKFIARENLFGKPPVRLLGGTIVFTYVENTGAFLSLGSKLPPRLKTALLMVAPGIVVIAAILYIIFKIAALPRVQLVALGCLIGGGISNLYDRISRGGAVVDFVHIGIGRLRTGIFNIADISIMFGAIFLIVVMMRGYRRN